MFCFILLVLTKEMKEELANMKTQMDELRLRLEESERCFLLSSRALSCLVFSLLLSCLLFPGLCFLALLAPLPHLVCRHWQALITKRGKGRPLSIAFEQYVRGILATGCSAKAARGTVAMSAQTFLSVEG